MVGFKKLFFLYFAVLVFDLLTYPTVDVAGARCVPMDDSCAAAPIAAADDREDADIVWVDLNTEALIAAAAAASVAAVLLLLTVCELAQLPTILLLPEHLWGRRL